MFEENIKVGKYVLNILKILQFCSCEICSNQACSLDRHLVEHFAITDICSMMGRGSFQDFRTKIVPKPYSEHVCILMGETLKFVMAYMRKRDKVDFFLDICS